MAKAKITTQISKENQQSELHKTIWKVANDLRGSVDGWDFKQYVLGIMFYRYISENLTNYINEKQQENEKDFDYTILSDEDAENGREAIVQEKGFFIPPSGLFCNVVKDASNNSDLNTTLENIFQGIEKSSLNLQKKKLKGFLLI